MIPLGEIESEREREIYSELLGSIHPTDMEIVERERGSGGRARL